ncbi:Uncharacterised protein [Candidatus Gugararchaeum adminiculabundum]|nr:Uncharacterised protein [Candidatus Gugararchaeum adminiculabundum]
MKAKNKKIGQTDSAGTSRAQNPGDTKAEARTAIFRDFAFVGGSLCPKTGQEQNSRSENRAKRVLLFTDSANTHFSFLQKGLEKKGLVAEKAFFSLIEVEDRRGIDLVVLESFKPQFAVDEIGHLRTMVGRHNHAPIVVVCKDEKEKNEILGLCRKVKYQSRIVNTKIIARNGRTWLDEELMDEVARLASATRVLVCGPTHKWVNGIGDCFQGAGECEVEKAVGEEELRKKIAGDVFSLVVFSTQLGRDVFIRTWEDIGPVLAVSEEKSSALADMIGEMGAKCVHRGTAVKDFLEIAVEIMGK